ncbi:hypothetical protein ACFLU6_15330 [Acidobacteriota bacterium]
MKWQEVFHNPKPAEIALVTVLLIFGPLYLIVRLSPDTTPAGGPGGPDSLAFASPGDSSGGLPFRTDDIDPDGALRVAVHPQVKIAYGAARNIFDFAVVKKPIKNNRLNPEPTRPPVKIDQPVVKNPDKIDPDKPPPPPPIEGFDYIGFMMSSQAQVAVLKKGEDIFLGSPEEIILIKDKEGKNSKEYKILDIRPDKLYMGYPSEQYRDYRQEIKFKVDKSEPSDEKPTTTKRGRR